MEQLIKEITRYCELAGIKETTFGLLSVNDGKLMHRLRLGRSCTLATADKIRAFMAANPPAPVTPSQPTAPEEAAA